MTTDKNQPFNIDLDQFSAARAEASGNDAPTLTLKGSVYQLPADLPASFLTDMSALESGQGEKLPDVLKMVFGEKYDEIMAKMNVRELRHVLTNIGPAYGMNSGE